MGCCLADSMGVSLAADLAGSWASTMAAKTVCWTVGNSADHWAAMTVAQMDVNLVVSWESSWAGCWDENSVAARVWSSVVRLACWKVAPKVLHWAAARVSNWAASLVCCSAALTAGC